MFFKFLLEKVSRRFENDYIHEIEYSWSVNIVKTGPILAVYCVQLSHAIMYLFSKYFQILYIFEQIFKYFALFLKNRTHAITFYNSHCKGKHAIVLKRLENYQNETFAMTVLNQYHKLRNIKMKQLCVVKQKTVETLQIWEKSSRIPLIGRKRSSKTKITEGCTEGFRQF